MNDSIRLHPQFGVNPTIPVCFWCGKDRNEVALLGAAYKGKAPMHMVIDHTPCAECEERMAKGITIAEAKDESDGAKLTGRWVVLTEEAIPKIFSPPELVERVLKQRRALIAPDAFQQLFGDLPTTGMNTESGEG